MQKSTELIFKTNFNNKLDNKYFLHLSFAPPNPLAEGYVRDTVVTIKTADNSHVPIKARLVDFWRIQFSFLSSVITFPSHALDYFDFCVFFRMENPDINSETLMAIYMYEKIKEGDYLF